MDCLHCGDCCKRMSPLSAPFPCLYIIKLQNYYFCGNYENRPDQCRNHDFPHRFCPIGLDVLKIGSLQEIRERIDSGYKKLRSNILC